MASCECEGQKEGQRAEEDFIARVKAEKEKLKQLLIDLRTGDNPPRETANSAKDDAEPNQVSKNKADKSDITARQIESQYNQLLSLGRERQEKLNEADVLVREAAELAKWINDKKQHAQVAKDLEQKKFDDFQSDLKASEKVRALQETREGSEGGMAAVGNAGVLSKRDWRTMDSVQPPRPYQRQQRPIPLYPTPNGNRCHYCNQLFNTVGGHLKGKCPNKRCFKCNKRGHEKKNCPNNPAPPTARGANCFDCDQFGHFARDCPAPKKCYTCNEYGHLSTACRLGLD